MFKTTLILAVICIATAQARFLTKEDPVATCLHDAYEAKVTFLEGAIDALNAKTRLEGLKLILDAGADAITTVQSCIHITKADIEEYVEAHLTAHQKKCVKKVFGLVEDVKSCFHGFSEKCIVTLLTDKLDFVKTCEHL